MAPFLPATIKRHSPAEESNKQAIKAKRNDNQDARRLTPVQGQMPRKAIVAWPS
jgi:hypothetical protein